MNFQFIPMNLKFNISCDINHRTKQKQNDDYDFASTNAKAYALWTTRNKTEANTSESNRVAPR